MKKFIILAAVSLLCASCFHVNLNFNGNGKTVKGKGPVIAKSFDLKDFDAICVEGFADVRFTQADTWEVTLRTHENIFDYVDYEVEDGVLHIRQKEHFNYKMRVYDLDIQAPVLKSIELNGMGELDIPDGLKVDGDLNVQVNGMGDLSIAGLVCRNLDVEVSGMGDACFEGEAETASFDVSGMGDIDADGLTVAGKVKKSKSGMGDIDI